MEKLTLAPQIHTSLKHGTNPKLFVNYDLFFDITQSEERLTVECIYSLDLFLKTTARQLLGNFQNLLE